MCQFGNESKILSEQKLTKDNALVGYRNWYITNSFNDSKEKHLKSTNMSFLWLKKKECIGNPTRNNSEGIYNYNNYNNYNCSNYYNYNYNYNYNCSNYSNYNYNYYIVGKTVLYGKVFSYKEGYRSSICIPTHLVILSDKKWFNDEKTAKFAEHFNKTITDLAKKYDCEVIGYDKYSRE